MIFSFRDLQGVHPYPVLAAYSCYDIMVCVMINQSRMHVADFLSGGVVGGQSELDNSNSITESRMHTAFIVS